MLAEEGTWRGKRAAVYIRVSTEEQAELSPDSQLSEIQRYAQREGIVLVRDQIYVDAGLSGRRADRRPQFLRMIATAKGADCPFDLILLWKYSRFARNQEESVFYKSILRSKCGVEVVSVTEPLLSGPFGSLIERIIEWMDEFYSIRLSQEVKRSMTVNAQRGKLQCVAAFGYQVAEGQLVPKEEEAPYVGRLFDWFLSGQGFGEIARRLNALGLRTHRGNAFQSRTVAYILRNPVYIGKLRWNPNGRTGQRFDDPHLILADGGHPPLVSQEVWDAAQRRLEELPVQPRSVPTVSSAPRRWSAGLVRCAACGGTLVFSPPHYYRCGRYAHGRCSHSQHIRADQLESALLAQLRQDLTGATPLRYRLLSSAEGDKAAETRADLRRLNQRKTRLQEGYLAGAFSLSDFTQMQQQLSEEIAAASAQLQSLSCPDAAGAELAQAVELVMAELVSTTISGEDIARALRSMVADCRLDQSTATLTITYRADLFAVSAGDMAPHIG